MADRERTSLALLRFLPRRGLSRLGGLVASAPLPAPLRPLVLRRLARRLGADLSEVPQPLRHYRSINAFFTRQLAQEARPLCDAAPAGLLSPADGFLTTHGVIAGDTLVQAKGHAYSLSELLVDPEGARRFEGGGYATIYLTPRHYHRVHCPLPGLLTAVTHIPGDLFPVFPAATATVPRLFVRNERVVFHLESDLGSLAVVMVGATNVGSITSSLAPQLRSNRVRGRGVAQSWRFDAPMTLAAGDELGVFNLGSTVVLCWAFPRLALIPAQGHELRMGQLLARI